MDHSLREGDVDAFAVEEFVDLLLAFVVHGPIVGGLHPHADGEVHAAVGEGFEANEGLLVGHVLHHATVGLEHGEDLFAHEAHVLAVVNAHHPLHAAVFFLRIVHHHGGAERTVGHVDLLAVGGEEDGVENLDFAHGALHALGFDPVAHAVGLEEEDDEAAGEVLEIAGEGHADCHTRRGQEGGEGRGVDAQGADDGDDEEDGEQDVDQTSHEALHAHVDVAAVEHGVDEAVNEFDQESTDEVDEQGAQNVAASRHAEVNQLFDELVELVYRELRRGGLQKKEIHKGFGKMYLLV